MVGAPHTLTCRAVELGDVGLEVAEAGEGGEPLLLVHGFTGAKEDFADWLDRFAELGFHVVAPDLGGHGQATSHDESAYSLEIFADDLGALVSELGWGVSRCSVIRWEAWPPRCWPSGTRRPARLVLMDTSHGSVQGIDTELVEWAAAVARRDGIGAVADILAEMESPLDTPAHIRLVADGRATPSSVTGSCESLRRPMRVDGQSAGRAGGPAAGAAWAHRSHARPGGALDRPFLDDAERLAAAIAGARLVIVPGAGHSPQFERPTSGGGAVSRFVQQVTPRAAGRAGRPLSGPPGENRYEGPRGRACWPRWSRSASGAVHALGRARLPVLRRGGEA